MDTLAEALKAFSDPTRLRILHLLEAGELCVCDLVAALELPQSKVSRHAAYLWRTGWVKKRRSGKWMYYTLTAFEDGFQGELLGLLRSELPCRDVAGDDARRLAVHLENKNPAACD